MRGRATPDAGSAAIKTGAVVCVFGSSLAPAGSVACEEARLAGALLAREGYTVCSGGYGGTMEAVSRGAKEAGGHTVGVTTDWFADLAPNAWLDQEIRTATYLDRIHTLIGKGAAYLALQGGVGTLTEISLVWSMLQTSSIPVRPFVLLSRPWRGLLQFAGESLIVRPDDLGFLRLANTPQDAVQIITTWLQGRV